MKKTFYVLVKVTAGLFLLVFILGLIPVTPNAFNHFLLTPVKKRFIGRVLQFKASRIWLPGSIFLQDVTIADSCGALWSAETVNIRYNLAAVLTGKKRALFSAAGVRFYTDVGLISSVARTLTMPNTPDVYFKAIDADLVLQDGAVYIKNAAAFNDNMAISGNGIIRKGGSLDCAVHFSFSSLLVDGMPDMIKTVLLQDEGRGWMGVTLNATGNYLKPSVRIDSQTFKMNIKETVVNSGRASQ